ncbi:putative protein polar localization during asymmetric division and redistribution [Helianthus annuus]|uniref:Uncharacterized protein n=2 Tax=Helianthus annuus TaxID=4232 RepID=A0A9K3JRR3_HELAN|nr:putative protein polar localization during asymmetric division and redistribution [Helianthus annuus]KAJ0952689.1 putative protein polar localization during asymmetric division and redistribution [Helianthus annuus]
MWQLLLAAAVAASGYVARNILYKDHNKPTNLFSHNHDLLTDSPKNASEEMSPVFRFCSASNGSKNVRKKVGRSGGIKGYRLNNERRVVNVDDDGKKKFGVCLKKRRVGRNGFAKCQSFDVKDKSSFGYGVGVGIMYMMSAGKAEIERLNAAVDETAKVVQELKAEISKRKSSYDSKVENTANIKQSVSEKSSEANNNIEVYGLSINDEGENASSVITEEPHRDVVEMEQLEAELESELLKLQVSTTSSSFQNKTTAEDLDLEYNQGNGVMPYELDQKLCHLLIEQQESQIVDLESELQHTNSKLVEKESELQALKDCVKRLSDLSVTCPSGTLLTFRVKLLYRGCNQMVFLKLKPYLVQMKKQKAR